MAIHFLIFRVLVAICSILGCCGVPTTAATLEHTHQVCSDSLEKFSETTAEFPPDVRGDWVSTRCEIRPGPEFVLRRYSFHRDYTFTLYQFYYSNDQCTEPSFSLKIRGKYVNFGQLESWLIPGGTEADYQLDRVYVTFYDQDIASKVYTAIVNDTCPGFIDEYVPWTTGVRYQLYNFDADKDCTAVLNFAIHELQLVRIENHKVYDDHQAVVGTRRELFLGDIATDPNMKMYYRSKTYQPPLAFHKDNCTTCQLIHNSDDSHPPVLTPQKRFDVVLQGEWISSRCEVRPIYFLVRHLVFYGNGTWEGYYYHFSDPACQESKFVVYGKGVHSEGRPSHRVKGGTEFEFTVNEMRISVNDVAIMSFLNIMDHSRCGDLSSWKLGVEKDITGTNGCGSLGVKLTNTDYELFSMEYNECENQIWLMSGQKPSDGSNSDSPEKRPTSYQSPLISCGEAKLLTPIKTASSEDVGTEDGVKSVLLSPATFLFFLVVAHYIV